MINEFHTFSITFAQKYGVNEAILMNHFYFWCEQNQLSGKNFKDGKTWTYASVADLTKRFIYMSESKIRTAIKNLVKKNIIIEGTFNKVSFDRTKWYAITDEGYDIYNECTRDCIKNCNKAPESPKNPICDFEQIDVSEMTNRDSENDKSDLVKMTNQICDFEQIRFGENHRPIPDTIHIQNNTTKNTKTSEQENDIGLFPNDCETPILVGNKNENQEIKQTSEKDALELKEGKERKSSAQKKESVTGISKSERDTVFNTYYENCKLLFAMGMIHVEKPVIAFDRVGRTLTKRIKDYGFENVLKVVNNACQDEWVVNTAGYEFSAIMSEAVFVKLLNGNITRGKAAQVSSSSNSKQSFLSKNQSVVTSYDVEW